VVPAQHGNTIDSVPRMGAVFHNDCLFLAFNALTLVNRYRAGLPAYIQRTAVMVDMAPLFRELGQNRQEEG
ncbi:unnamed protein product, partial [Choristocarpus tenellus]